MANSDPHTTWVFGNNYTQGTTANIFYTVPATAAATTTVSTESTGYNIPVQQVQNPTQYDWQTMQRLQMEYARQQRQYEAQLEYMRRMYMFGAQATLCGTGVEYSQPPEKLETKELSAEDRARLREVLPF